MQVLKKGHRGVPPPFRVAAGEPFHLFDLLFRLGAYLPCVLGETSMRATISTGLFILAVPSLFGLFGLPGCGGRSLLDDPSDELPLTNPNPSNTSPNSNPERDSGAGSSSTKDASTKDASAKESEAGSGSSSGGGAGTVVCGAETCTSATQDCCATMTGAMSGAASCVAKGQCTNGAVAMCTSAASCSGGDVCCVSLGGGTGGAPTGAGGYSVTCKKTCGTGGLQLC